MAGRELLATSRETMPDDRKRASSYELLADSPETMSMIEYSMADDRLIILSLFIGFFIFHFRFCI